MFELFTLADKQVLVGVMYQFYGTSWNLDQGSEGFRQALHELAHAVKPDVDAGYLWDFAKGSIAEDMFWHVCDALWKDGKLPLPDFDIDAPYTALDNVYHKLEVDHEERTAAMSKACVGHMLAMRSMPECHYQPGPCMGGERCTVGGCKDTGDTPPIP